MPDHAAINRVGEKRMDRAPGHLTSTEGLPAFKRPLLRADAFKASFASYRAKALMLIVKRKEPPYRLGLTFVQDQLPLVGIRMRVITKRGQSAHPEPSFGGGGQFISDPLCSDLTLKLRERQKDVER